MSAYRYPAGLGLSQLQRAPSLSLPTTPNAPVLVSAVGGNGEVTLTFTRGFDGGSPITHDVILRGLAPGTGVQIATGTSPYVDTTVVNGTTYYYTVASVNANGQGPQSNELSATPVAMALAPIGSQIVFYGDGTMSENGTPGLADPCAWALWHLNGKAMPSPGWMQARSGDFMVDILARIGAAIGQQADIAVQTSIGHNDGLLGTDPDVDPTVLDAWKVITDAWIAGNPDALYIPVCSTLPSTVANEALPSSFNPAITRAERVWQLQQAYIVAKADARIFYVATGEAYDPLTMSIDTANFYTHMDARGGYAVGAATLGVAIAGIMVAETKENVLAMLYAGTYPGQVGSNFDANAALAGTGGTLAGAVLPTGQYATGKRITNNLPATSAVVCSKGGTTPDSQISVISGTPGVQNTVAQDAVSLVTATATPGQYLLYSYGFVIDDGAGAAPVGMRGYYSSFGNYGSIGQLADAALSGTLANPLDSIMMVPPRALYSSSISYGARPDLYTRWSAVALDGRTVIERLSARIYSTRTRSAPCYFGNDTIQGVSYQLRLTGTLVAGAGTLRVETGSWAPYGLTETDFAERRIYLGGTAGNAGIGTGTLVATLSGSVWTWVTVGIVATDQLYCELTVNNGIGGNVVQRSETVYIAA